MTGTAPRTNRSDALRESIAVTMPPVQSWARFVLRRGSHPPRPPKSSSTTGSNEMSPSGASFRTIALLLAGLIVLGIIIATTTGFLIMRLREAALTQADHEHRSLALVLANQAERAFEAVELVQSAILAQFQSEDLQTPEGFRQRMSGSAVQEELRRRSSLLPQIDAIAISDSVGNVVNLSRPGPLPTPPVNVSDRDFYQGLKDHPERTLFISEPVQARSNGKWTMYIARRVSNRDGEFLGILQGAIELDYFRRLYQAVIPAGEAAITLFREDGRSLLRYPAFAPGKGAPYARTGPFHTPDTSAANVVVARLIRNIDGEDRLIAGYALGHYPMVVAVSNAVSSIMGEWRTQTTYLVGAAILLELVVSAVGLIMLRHIRGQRMLQQAQAARAAAEVAHHGAETARHRAEAELAVAHERERARVVLDIQNARFVAALNNMSQALVMFDAADSLVVANARVAEMFGVPTDTILPGVTMEALLGRLPGTSTLQQSDRDAMRSRIRTLKAANVRAAHTRELADGRVLAVNFVPIENHGWLLTYEDITERRRAEAKITHMAHHDALTELPNRVLFRDKLEEAVARSGRGEPCAVLYLDLDHFKTVNDTLGHPIGDRLLRAVTERLRVQIRETDTLARLGGDEFAVVQSSTEQPRDATILAERLIASLSAPYVLDGYQVMIGTSIGIALVPGDGRDPDQILKNADLALYRAKSRGRGRYCFFEPEMDALMQARQAMETDLRKAFAEEEFELYYQPLMNIETRSISGFEALLRWQHPERGSVQPAEFVPLAEEIGLIVPLGVWVLHRACADAMNWPDHMKVAVNVSVTQFESQTLVEDVATALRTSGLAPARLELEITETVMLDDTDAILVILHRLRDLGVGIAMDDFGTGYSSLNYLRRFPFSKVKIDRTFISDLGRDGDCGAIVKAVAELCETLGITTLAEGVETEEQLQQLRLGRCTEAQGYLFSPARPAAEVADLCRRLSPSHRAEPVG